jgi:hypothetical protein
MTVDDLQREVAKLSPAEVARFVAWLADYQAQLWDQQIADDLDAGRLDRLVQEVEREVAAGRSKPL